MKNQISFSDLLNFTSDNYSTSKNYDRVQITYKPKGEIIGELTISEDHEPAIVCFEKGGIHFQHKSVDTIDEACEILRKRKYSKRN